MAGSPMCAVAGVDATTLQEQAVAARQPGVAAAQPDQPGDQAGQHGGIARAGHANHRNAARQAVGVVVGKQVFANRLADRAGRADCRLQVHQQAGARIDLDDGAALARQRFADVHCHHIDTGDVEADNARCQHGGMGHFGMDQVGAIDPQVAVALDRHHPARCGHGGDVERLAPEFELQLGIGRRADQVERKFFLEAAPRVAVELAVDQLNHVRRAVARDGDDLATRCRHHAAADHQQPMLMAANEALDHHVAALGFGYGKSGFDFFACIEFERHPPAMVGVRRFHHHWQTDVFGRAPCLLGIGDDLAFGHRHAAALQQRLGQLLVAGYRLADGTGVIGLSRPDALLACAVTQLHQIAVVQPQMRNAPVGRGRNDARRAGAQVTVVELGTDHIDRALHVGERERVVVDGSHQQPMAFRQGGTRHLLVAGAKHHAVDALLRRAPGLAETGRHAGQVQQFDDNMLQHVAGPGAFVQPLDEAAALADTAVVLDQRGQQRGQAVGEARNQVRWIVFQLAEVEPHFEHRAVGPDVRTPQVGDLLQAHVGEARGGSVENFSRGFAFRWHEFSFAHGDQSKSAPALCGPATCANLFYQAAPHKHNATSRSSRRPDGRCRGSLRRAEKSARGYRKRFDTADG